MEVELLWPGQIATVQAVTLTITPVDEFGVGSQANVCIVRTVH